MAMKMKEVVYNPPTKQILAIPDHYVALGFKHLRAEAGDSGLAILQDGRYIVKAGTIYPANDATAMGVILNDYDVTDGDAMMAVVMHGFIKVAALPEIPTMEAKLALKNIKFVDSVDVTSVGVLDYDKPIYTYPDTAYNIIAYGHHSVISKSNTPTVDFDINISGISAKFLDGVKAGLGFATQTHALVILVEVPHKKGILFDPSKVKFNGNAQDSKYVEYRNGKWYLAIVKGILENNGSITTPTTTFTLGYDTEDPLKFQYTFNGLTLEA